MERISRFRAILLLILFITILALFAVKLFDLQIIKTNGNTDNIAKYTTVTTVRAARCDILDRNGNKLVSNRASYDLVFNHYVIESYGHTNEALYALVQKPGLAERFSAGAGAFPLQRSDRTFTLYGQRQPA